MSTNQKPREFWIENHFDWVTHKMDADNNRDDTIHVIEYSAYKALEEKLAKAIKSLEFYGKREFDRVCFLDHSTCCETYGADARQTLAEITKGDENG